MQMLEETTQHLFGVSLGCRSRGNEHPWVPFGAGEAGGAQHPGVLLGFGSSMDIPPPPPGLPLGSDLGQAGPPTPAPPRTVAGAASPGRTGARGGGGRWLEQCPAGQAPLFEGLGDSDVGLATVPTGDCDLADGIGLPVPASSASFTPNPLGMPGQHPDTPFLEGFCLADPGVAPSPRAGDPRNGLGTPRTGSFPNTAPGSWERDGSTWSL